MALQSTFRVNTKLTALSLLFSLCSSFIWIPAAFADDDDKPAQTETLSDAEMEKEFALPLDNLEDIGYTLQRVKQQAVDLYTESTRKKRESKVLSRSMVIPREKLHPIGYYQPLRKAWLAFFVCTMEPLVQLLVHDVHEVEKHLSDVKIIRGKQKQFDHVYAKWREYINSINRHLDVLNEQLNLDEPNNLIVAEVARSIDVEINQAMQMRLHAYDILAQAGPAVGKSK